MPNQRKFFGTDGVRGLANREPLTPEFTLALGRAIGQLAFAVKFPFDASAPTIVIGKDTRISCDLLESALATGIVSTGCHVKLAGVLPTPAVAFLARQTGALFGAVISASHNHFADNGIKFFTRDGFKLSDEAELLLESMLPNIGNGSGLRPTGTALGRISILESSLEHYVQFAGSTLPKGFRLSGLKVALDAANGAAHRTTPMILKELGAEVAAFNIAPNGVNINQNCGSTFPEEIVRRLRETSAQVGLAHDGDADRLLLCDETGEVLDGDDIMAIAAIDLLEKGKLAENTLVTTVMSNFGLNEAIKRQGGQVVRTQVGDRYVLEAMLKNGYNFGGEQSGHLIFLDYHTAGDGVISALQILRIIQEKGKPLSELRKCLKKYPQVQRNVSIPAKPPLENLKTLQKELLEIETQLEGQGRVLLRYSGTESKLRLLVEGPDEELLNQYAEQLVAVALAEIAK